MWKLKKNIKVFNQADICKTVKKTYNVEYKELPSLSKTLDITKNGNYQVTPDCGYTLSKANVNVNVKSETPTPVVTNESTELIADYAYWLKELGRAGAKVFLSDQVPNGIHTQSFYYFARYPLEIGKIKSCSKIVNRERTIDFEIYLKKGTNYVYIIYNNAFNLSISDFEFIKSIQIPNCTCDYTATKYIMGQGNLIDDVEIEANEEGLYEGSLIISDYLEGKVYPRIRFCKSVAAMLYNMEFPSAVTYDDLVNDGVYGSIDKVNFKNIIIYTTNPQSYDWKLKKVNISDGVYLKYHRTYLNKVDLSIVRTKKPINYIPDLTIKTKTHDYINNESIYSLNFSIGKQDPKIIANSFREDINTIFGTHNVEIYCKKHKSIIMKNDDREYTRVPIGKLMEYSLQIEKIFTAMSNSLILQKDFFSYTRNKFGSKNTLGFYMKIRIFKNNNSNYYYYRLKYNIDLDNYKCYLASIIFEKIENNTIQKY